MGKSHSSRLLYISAFVTRNNVLAYVTSPDAIGDTTLASVSSNACEELPRHFPPWVARVNAAYGPVSHYLSLSYAARAASIMGWQ